MHMLNPELKLNPSCLLNSVSQPIRDGFGNGLVQLGEENENIVGLTADLKESTRMEAFAKKFPKRFFDLGVAEQNLVTVAAGFAMSGKIPFAASYAAFSPGRNWEQIRTCIAYNNANVKIIGSHAGLTVGPDGATHQVLEDIALMRVMPNMHVFSPCDAIEAEKTTIAMGSIYGPGYLRLSREKSPLITTPETPFTPGKIEAFWISSRPECSIFATGDALIFALKAAALLDEEGIRVSVFNVHTIKPLDIKTVVAAAKKTKAVVTVEDHQIAGGLGGVISETLASSFPCSMEFVGVEDIFGRSGKPDELLKKYGITPEHIARAVKRAIKKK